MILRRNNHNPRRIAQAAFTLVEVVVAVGILGISFVSLYAGMSAGFALTQVSRENLRATQIMVERMEGIRLYNWDQITVSNMVPTTFTTRYYPAVGGGTPSGIVYKGTVTITNVTLSPTQPAYANDLRLVSVEIQWDSGSVTRTRRMSTLVSKSGLQNYVYDR